MVGIRSHLVFFGLVLLLATPVYSGSHLSGSPDNRYRYRGRRANPPVPIYEATSNTATKAAVGSTDAATSTYSGMMRSDGIDLEFTGPARGAVAGASKREGNEISEAGKRLLYEVSAAKECVKLGRRTDLSDEQKLEKLPYQVRYCNFMKDASGTSWSEVSTYCRAFIDTTTKFSRNNVEFRETFPWFNGVQWGNLADALGMTTLSPAIAMSNVASSDPVAHNGRDYKDMVVDQTTRGERDADGDRLDEGARAAAISSSVAVPIIPAFLMSGWAQDETTAVGSMGSQKASRVPVAAVAPNMLPQAGRGTDFKHDGLVSKIEAAAIMSARNMLSRARNPRDNLRGRL